MKFLRAAVVAAALAFAAPALAVDIAYAGEHDEDEITQTQQGTRGVPASFAITAGGKVYYTGYLPAPKRVAGSKYEQFSKEFIADLPDNYDSRTDTLQGACDLPIRNQGSCGSCWAFSRTAALECAKIRSGLVTSIDLAEQDTVANDRQSSGCGGGYMGFPYETEDGVTLESTCPYTARNTSCRSDHNTKGKSWTFIGDSRNGPTPDDLRAAIFKYGYVSVTTAAGGGGYDTNSDGVFIGCGSRGINHLTDYVAYRKMSDGTYQFLMRNSWGTGWGMNGYAWGKQGCNQTGIGDESAAVVVVDGPGPQPAIKLAGAPVEVVVDAATEFPISVKAEDGVSYSWTLGNQTKTGDTIWVKGYAGPVTLTGTKGTAKVSTIINVTQE